MNTGTRSAGHEDEEHSLWYWTSVAFGSARLSVATGWHRRNFSWGEVLSAKNWSAPGGISWPHPYSQRVTRMVMVTSGDPLPGDLPWRRWMLGAISGGLAGDEQMGIVGNEVKAFMVACCIVPAAFLPGILACSPAGVKPEQTRRKAVTELNRAIIPVMTVDVCKT